MAKNKEIGLGGPEPGGILQAGNARADRLEHLEVAFDRAWRAVRSAVAHLALRRHPDAGDDIVGDRPRLERDAGELVEKIADALVDAGDHGNRGQDRRHRHRRPGRRADFLTLDRADEGHQIGLELGKGAEDDQREINTEIDAGIGQRGQVVAEARGELARHDRRDVVRRLTAAGGLFSAKGGAGTALIFGDSIVHASPSNMSPWDRRIFSLIVNPISNAYTSSARPDWKHHRDLTPVTPLDDDCLLAAGR